MTLLPTAAMHIVFCADRRVIPGLHVAAFSLLERFDQTATRAEFHLFSEDFTDADTSLLGATLDRTGKRYALTRHRIDPARFSGFPPLHGSHATYYRLMVPQALGVGRFLYVDADTLCDIDVSPLEAIPMGDAPAAWVPEAPLPGAVDRRVAEQLGNRADRFYFNAGVMVVNTGAWHGQRVTAQAMEYLAANEAAFHDQSSLNWVLRDSARPLDERYNLIVNKRHHWSALRRPYGQIGCLVHFVDSPKPWDFLGGLFHPQHALWCSVLRKTALAHRHARRGLPARLPPRTLAAVLNYKKAAKDRLLFDAYRRGWLRRVKGIATSE